MEKDWIFDIPWAKEFARARKVFLAEFLDEVRLNSKLTTAVDVGCGVGEFSRFLMDRGLQVVGVDGREENVIEARRRHPEITFLTRDAENLPLQEMFTFDLVLCLGLLYHLENPFRAVRNLHTLTGKVLIIETMCVPDSLSTMELLDEGLSENQSLNYVAFYPSESCLVKMLYRAGFPFVFYFTDLPADPLYRETIWRKRFRTIIVASKVELTAPGLIRANEPVRWAHDPSGPWSTRSSRAREFCRIKLASLRGIGARLLNPFRRKRHSGTSADDAEK